MLVHGLGGHWAHWHRVLGPLSDHHRVIALDLPGFGATALPHHARQMSFDFHVDTVAALATKLGVRRVVLAGHSMGGPLALRFAARHSHLAAGLVLVCGTVQQFQGTLAGRISPWLRAPKTAIATVAEVVLTAVPVPAPVRRLIAGNPRLRSLALWPFAWRPAALSRDDALILANGAGARGVLPTVRALGRLTGWEENKPGVPTCLLNGAEDPIAPLQDLARFPVEVQHVSVIPRAGHMVMLEAPQQTVSLLLHAIECVSTEATEGEA